LLIVISVEVLASTLSEVFYVGLCEAELKPYYAFEHDFKSQFKPNCVCAFCCFVLQSDGRTPMAQAGGRSRRLQGLRLQQAPARL
jgi:hypothetical protein